MIILDGKKLSLERKEILKEKVRKLSEKPRLAIIQIGEHAATNIYVQKKKDFGKEIGVEVESFKFPEEFSTDEIKKEIQKLNENEKVHGIIIQLPVPEHIDKESLINSLSQNKDVDGLSAINLWKLLDEKEGIVSATARGIETLLREHNIDFYGSHIVIIGDSFLVGRPIAINLLNKGATITLCNSKTKDLASITKQADIIIVAVGKADLINSSHVKEGQTIIDVGINRKENGKLVGDVDFESVKNIVSSITPVPGGVGPMTVVSLFENLIERM
jgi:methylenetetrahydrofolate dehydrogenase (NADP+) / methenyltetrahydrofolate cyclohydrolase